MFISAARGFVLIDCILAESQVERLRRKIARKSVSNLLIVDAVSGRHDPGFIQQRSAAHVQILRFLQHGGLCLWRKIKKNCKQKNIDEPIKQEKIMR